MFTLYFELNYKIKLKKADELLRTLSSQKLYNSLIENKNHWYNSDCEFVWAFCRYFWEAHVQLPDIDINELEKFVNENK